MQTQPWKISLATVLIIALSALAPVAASADATPDTATRNYSGAITARTTDLISIGTNIFSITPDTVWTYQGQPVTDLTAFGVGDIVVIKAAPDGTSWKATDVILMANLVPDSISGQQPVKGAQAATFSGAIESRSDNDITVEATSLMFNAQTKWTAGGNVTTDMSKFAVGDQVVATASYDGKNWTATNVDLLMDVVSDATQPAPQPAPSAPAPTAQSFSGTVKSISTSAMDVGDNSFQLNAQTQWLNADGTPTQQTSIGVGDTVQVKAIQTGSTWMAQSVTLIQHSPPMGGASPSK